LIEINIFEDDLPEEIMERIAGKICDLGIILKKVEETGDENTIRVFKYLFVKDIKKIE
jgi:hypothetical protein